MPTIPDSPRYNPPSPPHQVPPLAPPLEPKPPPQPTSPTKEEERNQFSLEGVGNNKEDTATVIDLSPHSISFEMDRFNTTRVVCKS